MKLTVVARLSTVRSIQPIDNVARLSIEQRHFEAIWNFGPKMIRRLSSSCVHHAHRPQRRLARHFSSVNDVPDVSSAAGVDASAYSVIDTMEQAIHGFHGMTGLPWWETIVVRDCCCTPCRCTRV